MSKRAWIGLGLFLVGLVAGDRILAAALAGVLSQSSHRFVEVYEGRAPAQLLAVGNSRAHLHFTPAQMNALLGVDAVNLGLGGISTHASEVMLRDYIEKNGKPALVILEATSLQTPPRDSGDLRLFGIYSDRMRAFTREHEPKMYYATEASRLLLFNSDLAVKGLMRVFVSKDAARNVRQGIDRRQREAWEAKAGERAEVNPVFELGSLTAFKVPPIDPANGLAMERIIRFLNAEKIPLRLIITPYYPGYLDQTHYDNWAAELRRIVGGEAEIWDYHSAVDRVDAFRDRVHLSGRGNRLLQARLCADGFFAPFPCNTDALGDSGVADPGATD